MPEELQYSCRYQRSAHHLAKRTLFLQTCQPANICLDMFCCLLEIQKIDRWREKLCTNIKKLSHRIKQQVYGPLAFGGSLPRGAQSSYLTSDHHPVGTEPASVRGISRGRALYRRHIVLDCLRCQWETGTASYRRHIFCLLVPVQCGRETHHTISGPCRLGIRIWLAELWLAGYHMTWLVDQRGGERVHRWQQKSARLRSNRRRQGKHIACATANGPDKNKLFQQSRIGWIVVVSPPHPQNHKGLPHP